ncbi:sugar transferase [Rhizobium sp. LjRoot254]|uniref:sugar transferase n=1 Tax=Rhizobium sp. LjRoot254 TaxID=3342297 RepID=UPI003ECE4EC4
MSPLNGNYILLGFITLLCDVIYILTALLVADTLIPQAFPNARSVMPLVLTVLIILCAVVWSYAMGLYRVERLVARDMILPLLTTFVLVALCAMTLVSLSGFRDTLQNRWLTALPLAFCLMFIGRIAFAHLARLDSASAAHAIERRQIGLEALRPDRLGSPFCHERSRLSNGVKRCMDIVLSSILLAFTLPVTLATMLAIVIEDGRPIFYLQERVGRNGKTFLLYKFRSMRRSAEADGVPRWAQLHDDRVTRVGRFLRRSRIDEFPQFFNVLAGHMSLVGPRPERPAIAANLEKEIPNYWYRCLVKPGITGWAQINYPYGASLHDAQEKTKYDFFYLQHGSVVLDAKILLQTVRVILIGEGAR